MGGLDFRLAHLYEAKSKKPDRYVRLQIIHYQDRIWAVDQAQKRPLSFVLPSVVYNGVRKWDKKPFSASFKNLPIALLPYLPEFEYLFLNLPKMTDKEIIQKSEGKMLASGFLAMKHARERDYFWKNFAKVFNFDWRSYAEPTWQAFMKIMLPYIGNATGITNREFQPLSKQLPAELNYFTMLTMEIFKDEFKEEGLREGRIEGLKEFAKFLLINFPKYTDKKIAVTTTLPEPTIVQLRKELEEKKPNGKGHENKNKKADRNKNGHKNGKSKK